MANCQVGLNASDSRCCYDDEGPDLVILFVHVVATLTRLEGPDGIRSVVAESVLFKQQLLILNCSSQRVPNLGTPDRLVAGLCVLLIRPAYGQISQPTGKGLKACWSVVPQHAAQSLAAHDLAGCATQFVAWFDGAVVKPLMVSFGMITGATISKVAEQTSYLSGCGIRSRGIRDQGLAVKRGKERLSPLPKYRGHRALRLG
jgi:hypothetical protein